MKSREYIEYLTVKKRRAVIIVDTCAGREASGGGNISTSLYSFINNDRLSWKAHHMWYYWCRY
ncbi:hypothetical protein DR73_3297 [Enterobacteriaceae bacterium ATCC 29904]|nr:hypothetical protein DR73_3297 [Enterobacteriaceae bacterium ATCC 29904]